MGARTVLENDKAKLIWDFEFKLRKTKTSRRPHLILEEKDEKKIWICEMACPQQRSLEKKRDIFSKCIRNKKLVKNKKMAIVITVDEAGDDEGICT